MQLMITKFALIPFEKAINQALKLDESLLQQLQDLQGKVLLLIITPLSLSFFIHFTAEKVALLETYEDTPDTTIESSPLGLIRLTLLPPSKARSLFNDTITISGDVELGNRIKQIFDTIDIDWEGHIAHFTGDAVAHQIGSIARQGLSFAKSVKNSFTRNMTSYLHEEVRLFPSREEINDFFNDIDELVLHVERIEAHVHQLVTYYETC
jgi:ubiquinone biosynthesis protein UbiJ